MHADPGHSQSDTPTLQGYIALRTLRAQHYVTTSPYCLACSLFFSLMLLSGPHAFLAYTFLLQLMLTPSTC